MNIYIMSSSGKEPAKVRLIEQSPDYISFSFEDPEDDDLFLLNTMKDAMKSFSIEVDGETRFVEVARIDETVVELRTEKSTELKMSFKPD